jgi:two-component system, NtrC family, sensor histidine kinase KinB
MEEGRMALDCEPLSPYGLADQAIERLRGSAQSQQVELNLLLPLGLPTVEADREKIVRVLQNLLDNAIKFSPARDTVTMGAHRHGAPVSPLGPQQPPLEDGEWLVFWVRDNGPGVPAAYHERIFEKFGQVRGRRTRGTGLGLTFCKLAVEAHSGHIWLESAEGHGSVFALALPIAHDLLSI